MRNSPSDFSYRGRNYAEPDDSIRTPPYDARSPAATLLELPTELHISILSLCSMPDLVHVSRTCQQMNQIGTSLLYSTVDLSSHKLDIDYQSDASSSARVPPDFVRRKWTWHDYNVYRRQDCLLRTFAEKSKIGKHVRKLHWTSLDLAWSCEDDWEDHELAQRNKEEEDPGSVLDQAHDKAMDNGTLWPLEKETYRTRREAVLRMFQSFINATHIDICWLDECREPNLLIPLFPSAKSIRLSGLTTLHEVNNILAPSREKLKHLELNNLLQWSAASPPLPQFSSSEQLEAYCRLHSAEHKPIPNTRLLTGALDSMLGHFTALTSLCITTAGNRGDWIGSKPWDDRRYSSWTRFLTSVRGQLHQLSFKQGTSKAIIARLWSCRRGEARACPYMVLNMRFGEYIMPVLLEATWPRIKRMEIKGVDFGVAVEYMPEHVGEKMQVDFKQSLRALLPHNAELVLEEEQEREYEVIPYDDLGLGMFEVDSERE